MPVRWLRSTCGSAGSAPAALRRVGRFGDGWLGSFLTPAEAGRARESIITAAAEAGRSIEPDHFGITVLFAEGGVPPQVGDLIRRQRPDCDPGDLIADSWPALHRLLDGLRAGRTDEVRHQHGGFGTHPTLHRQLRHRVAATPELSREPGDVAVTHLPR